MTLREKLTVTVVVGDGAVGTQLQHAGLPAGTCPELWGAEHAHIVVGIHRQYVEAEADFVTTNTFGGNRVRLRRFGLEDRVEELNRRNVELALEAAGREAWVAGSMGPTGELLAPLGDLPPEQVEEGFAEQAAALQTAGVHFLLIETMTSIEEAAAAVHGARSASTLPILLSFSFERGARGFRTFMGVSIPQAVEAFAFEPLTAIGFNCGRGYEEAADITRELTGVARIPVLVQPNGGLPEQPQSAEQVRPYVDEILRAGVRLIGGCCGTDASFISMIRRQADCYISSEVTR